ncbi:MAG TPA: hypothetical protein PLN52_02610, partial [Opitutaceae bacterium]|nr:hypothetical protein [Opitutaceae bacterium]
MSTARPRLRKQWQAFRRSPPGKRFEQHYRRSRRQRENGSAWVRPLKWVIALLSAIVGVILVFIPGPAVLFFALTGLVLASESKAIARLLDGAEVKARSLMDAVRRRWSRMGKGGKCAVGGVALILAGVLVAAAVLWWR